MPKVIKKEIMHNRIFITGLLLLLIMDFSTSAAACSAVAEKLDSSVSRAAVIVVGEVIEAHSPVKPKDGGMLWEKNIHVLRTWF